MRRLLATLAFTLPLAHSVLSPAPVCAVNYDPSTVELGAEYVVHADDLPVRSTTVQAYFPQPLYPCYKPGILNPLP